MLYKSIVKDRSLKTKNFKSQMDESTIGFEVFYFNRKVATIKQLLVQQIHVQQVPGLISRGNVDQNRKVPFC